MNLPAFSDDLDEAELRDPTFINCDPMIWHSIRSFFVERPGQIIASTFILIMIWARMVGSNCCAMCVRLRGRVWI